MTHTLKIAAAAAALAAASFALAGPATTPATGRRVLADFEAFGAGDAIASAAGATAKPWRRFGEATADNVVATSDPANVLAGKTSALYPVFWPNKFGAASMAVDPPLDLSGDAAVRVTVRSTNAETKTQARISVSDGKTTYTSKTPQRLTDKPQTLTFSLAAADMERVDGPRAALADVLAKATSVGLKFTSDGSKYAEKILFDDLAVTK